MGIENRTHVQQLTGLAITSYVGVDLDRLTAAVGAVSGVALCVASPVQDGVLGPIVPDPGPVTLDGTRVGDYVRRWRRWVVNPAR